MDGGPERLMKVVLALPELPLRVEWLRDSLITGNPALLAVCTRSELLEVVHATDSNLVLRATALELLERRPPLAEPDGADSVVLQ